MTVNISYRTAFSLLLCCLLIGEIYGQRDSLLNKTWIGVMGDVFHLSEDRENAGDYFCHINYGKDSRFNAFVTDSSFIFHSLRKGSNAYNYQYHGDSITLVEIEDLDHSQFKSMYGPESFELQGSKKPHHTYEYTSRLAFYDSTFYFQNYPKFEEITIESDYRTIKLNSSGNLLANYKLNNFNYTNRVGDYTGLISEEDIDMINRELHLVKFEMWDALVRNRCSSSSDWALSFYTVAYHDTVFERKKYYSDCKGMLPSSSFGYSIISLVNDMSFRDSSNAVLLEMVENKDSYSLVYGKPNFVSTYYDDRDELNYLYRLVPDSFYSPSDSMNVGYFSSSDELDTTLVKLHVLGRSHLYSRKFKEPVEDYYRLVRTYWAPHETWFFRDPYPNKITREEIERVPRRYKRFLFIRIKNDADKNLIRALKRENRRTKEKSKY